MRCKMRAKLAPTYRGGCAVGLLLSIFGRSRCIRPRRRCESVSLRRMLGTLLSRTIGEGLVRSDIICESLFSAELVGYLVPHPTRMRGRF